MGLFYVGWVPMVASGHLNARNVLKNLHWRGAFVKIIDEWKTIRMRAIAQQSVKVGFRAAGSTLSSHAYYLSGDVRYDRENGASSHQPTVHQVIGSDGIDLWYCLRVSVTATLSKKVTKSVNCDDENTSAEKNNVIYIHW